MGPSSSSSSSLLGSTTTNGPRRRRRIEDNNNNSSSTSLLQSQQSQQHLPSPPPGNNRRNARVVFVHLDLGIGGAEQLVLNLAAASQDLGLDVTIVTSRCSQSHCFSQVKKPHGRLCRNVRVWGKFLPANILGMGTAFCSTIRLLYLSFWVAKKYGPKADMLVLDVLPTPIPFLTTWCHSGILYYCHFPDKLLTRDTVNGELNERLQEQQQQQNGTAVLATSSIVTTLKKWYRQFLDEVEEEAMAYADVLVANSSFTRHRIQDVFPSLADERMKVLYPALDMDKFSPPRFDPVNVATAPIVSLNRFERKKNIELLLEAYAMLLQPSDNDKQRASSRPLPPLVIAGGYDIRNVENVEYLQELKSLAARLSITDHIRFRPSVSDQERSELMQTALCIVYTPHLEHFGIVPLEAMYAGRPVVAVNSGGPKETIVHNVTGFLCDKTPEAFCRALQCLLDNPSRVVQMGKAGHEHVKTHFGRGRFQQQWRALVTETIEAGKVRRFQKRREYYVWRTFYYLLDGLFLLVTVTVVTFVLRRIGVLEPDQHFVGYVRETIGNVKRNLM